MKTMDIGFLKSRQMLLSSVFSKKGGELLVYIVIFLIGLFLMFLILVAFAPNANAQSRIKDVVSVEGIRDNVLVGYGLVVGLNGTGDKLNNSTFTEKSLESFLERVGVNVSDKELKAKNVAAVTVTATLPPFARSGSKIDVAVGTLGDAKSLQGGTLVATPLMGADGEVYAVAQGAVAIGGFEASGKSGTSVSKGVPTSGFISNGGIVEKEIDFALNSMEKLRLALRNPDMATAKRIAESINTGMADKGFLDVATVTDPGTVVVTVPEGSKDSVANLLAEIEQYQIEPDQSARVIIDEASGTIVMNENVRIDTVAIAQGNLIVSIKEATGVSQPGLLAPEGAQTVAAPVTEITIEEGKANKMAIMEKGANLRDLVNGLNALGVGPRDLITILQTIKAAGALQAEIEAR